MSFDWHAYLNVADELINQQRTPSLEEAYFRSAISRSYYSAFGIARAFLSHSGVSLPLKDTHKTLREEFKNSPDRTKKKIGLDLDRLWKERKDADYEGKLTVKVSKAQISYQIAHRILQDLKSLKTP
jgi:uncharacterized protein (UPF0332 family)